MVNFPANHLTTGPSQGPACTHFPSFRHSFRRLWPAETETTKIHRDLYFFSTLHPSQKPQVYPSLPFGDDWIWLNTMFKGSIVEINPTPTSAVQHGSSWSYAWARPASVALRIPGPRAPGWAPCGGDGIWGFWIWVAGFWLKKSMFGCYLGGSMSGWWTQLKKPACVCVCVCDVDVGHFC